MCQIITAEEAIVIIEELDHLFKYDVPLFFDSDAGITAKIKLNFNLVIEKDDNNFYCLSAQQYSQDKQKPKVLLRKFRHIGEMVDSVSYFFRVKDYKFDSIKFVPTIKKYSNLIVVDSNDISVSATMKNQNRITISSHSPCSYTVAYRRPTDVPREWYKNIIHGEMDVVDLINGLGKE